MAHEILQRRGISHIYLDHDPHIPQRSCLSIPLSLDDEHAHICRPRRASYVPAYAGLATKNRILWWPELMRGGIAKSTGEERVVHAGLHTMSRV